MLPWVPREKTVNQPAARFHDLAGDLHEGTQKRRVVHFQQRLFFAVLSVTTFWSFLREFSPLEVYGGGIG